MNLYQISQETQTKIDLLGQMLMDNKEPSDEFVSELLDLQDNLTAKLVNYGFVVKTTNADIDSLDKEIARLNALKKAKQNTVAILKSRMEQAMIDNGLTKIDDPILPIKIQKSPPGIRLDIDPVHLPQKFQKIAISADKTALKKAIESGEYINGVSLVQGEYVKIG